MRFAIMGGFRSRSGRMRKTRKLHWRVRQRLALTYTRRPSSCRPTRSKPSPLRSTSCWRPWRRSGARSPWPRADANWWSSSPIERSTRSTEDTGNQLADAGVQSRKGGMMLRNIKDLRGYVIRAIDGTIGKVDDFYFDDEDWGIRYLVVDTGSWLSGRKVLISP